MTAETVLSVADTPTHRLLTLARPERRNALTVQLVEEMAAAIRSAPGAGARAIIITGEGRSFCSGGDLPSLAALAEQGSAVVSDAIYASFHGLVRALRDSPLPAIAAVNGHALGAGLDLALCCDLRIAGPNAVFESTWIKAGLIPGMAGAYRLPHVIGATRAAQMLLEARRVDAVTALSWGLVNDVAADGDVVALAAESAARIAALPALAVARTKASLRRSIEQGLDAELATLGAQQGQLLSGEDFAQVARGLVTSSRRS